ncbi:MAG: T9SS type A sorting domain-containing protein [Bacteroidetes bacterium]|nr:T9SS type A sorting domain-containing protein [Bacteroidota bacterium]
MKRLFLLNLIMLLSIYTSFAQLVLVQNDSIPVKINGSFLKNAWAGGINYGQFSTIDLNFDGLKDLVVFDRTGNKILPFINNGTPDSIDYSYAPKYISKFPNLLDWALFVDYNGDGKEDIFTYSQGGFSVFTNISGPGIGLFFRLDKYIVKSHYSAAPNDYLGLYVSRVDIPALVDVDYDGDIDVLTFDINSGSEIEFHRNMSMENYGVPDSLNDFKLDASCWGGFLANTTNTVTLHVACKPAPSTPYYDTTLIDKTLHVGSTELALDMDNDHDYDMLLGGVSTNDLNLLTNGGNSISASISSQENFFPAANVPIDITIFPAAFYLDVNNDGQKDLIAAPNAGNSSENFNSAWYYKDVDTTAACSFSYQTSSFMQNQMIEVGEGAYPAFFDYNGDGLKDLVVGNYGYFNAGGSYSCKLALFKNIGSTIQPQFELVSRDYAGLSVYNLSNLNPDFGDVDGDGDMDMVIGTNNNAGSILYFENLAGAGNTANFVLANATLLTVVGQFPAPQLVDVNRDGKVDLLIGIRNGTLSYYQNVSTIGNVNFSQISTNFGNVSVAPYGAFIGYCSPKLVDESGTYHLYAGNVDGNIYHYDSIDGNLNGTFALKDTLYSDINEGDRLALAFSDLNSDGYMDMVLGNYSGGLTFYKGKQKVTGLASLDLKNSPVLNLFPNPAKDFVQVRIVNELPSTKKTIRIYNVLGKLIAQSEITSNNILFETQEWSKGIYYCKVEVAETSLMKKFAVVK